MNRDVMAYSFLIELHQTQRTVPAAKLIAERARLAIAVEISLFQLSLSVNLPQAILEAPFA